MCLPGRRHAQLIATSGDRSASPAELRASRIRPCAGADRPAQDGPPVELSPAAFVESWKGHPPNSNPAVFQPR